MAMDERYPSHEDGRMAGSQNDLTTDVESSIETANYGVARAADASTGLPVQTAVRLLGATGLMSDKVVDVAGEDIGQIEELMIDLSNGGISYAVLSYGSIMGMGGKLFAIPWRAFTVDADNKQLVLSVSKDMLDNAPGFDKNNWPDMTKEEFRSEIYGYYGHGGAGYEGFHGRDTETSMSGLSGTGSQNM